MISNCQDDRLQWMQISGFRECMKVLKHIRILHTVTYIFNLHYDTSGSS